MTRNIVFVDTFSSAAAACARLGATSAAERKVLAMDMELICDGTTASLIQFAVSDLEVYIFDVTVLGQELFNACYLLPILTGPHIIKLCYDCRVDADILFTNHGVLVHGLYDMQIVYTSLFQTPHDPYLKGLNKAVRKIMSPTASDRFAFKKQTMKKCFSSSSNSLKTEIMRQRPLSQETLEYCADDTTVLLAMFAAWHSAFAMDAVLYSSRQRAIIHRLRKCRGKQSSSRKPPPLKAMHHVDFDQLLPLFNVS